LVQFWCLTEPFRDKKVVKLITLRFSCAALLGIIGYCATNLLLYVLLCARYFRFDNIVKEFKQYELSDLTRIVVGTKIASATACVGIWYPSLC
jgi:hypothetical protein